MLDLIRVADASESIDHQLQCPKLDLALFVQVRVIQPVGVRIFGISTHLLQNALDRNVHDFVVGIRGDLVRKQLKLADGGKLVQEPQQALNPYPLPLGKDCAI